MGQATVNLQNAGLKVSSTNPLPVTDAANGTAGTPATSVGTVQGIGYAGSSTITRAANTTAYTAGDVVGGALTIATIGPSGGGHVIITSVRMLLNLTAIPAGMSSFRLHLYNVTPPSAIADNSPFTLGSGDRSAYICHIDNLTPALIGTGTGSPQAQITALVEQVVVPSGGTLYGYLETIGAFTPAANSETYTLAIRAVGV